MSSNGQSQDSAGRTVASLAVSASSVAIVFALLAIAVAGCNTIKGMGEDVAAAGQTIADKAAQANR